MCVLLDQLRRSDTARSNSTTILILFGKNCLKKKLFVFNIIKKNTHP